MLDTVLSTRVAKYGMLSLFGVNAGKQLKWPKNATLILSGNGAPTVANGGMQEAERVWKLRIVSKGTIQGDATIAKQWMGKVFLRGVKKAGYVTLRLAQRDKTPTQNTLRQVQRDNPYCQSELVEDWPLHIDFGRLTFRL